MLTAPPAAVVDDGVLWTVSRAWPTPGGADLEAHAVGAADVRGGHWSADGGVRLLPAGADSRLPALEAARSEGAVIVHRPGRRAVVRAADGASFLKVLRPRAAPGVIAAHASARGFAAGFAVPTVLRRAGDPDGLVRLGTLPGRTLHDIGADPSTTPERWTAIWEQWSEGWSLLPEAAPELPDHGPDAEASVVATWAAHAATVLPSRARVPLLAAAAVVAERLVSGRAEPLVLAHRDLHDKQLLASDGSLALLDLDTAARAEAALDLGNLRAHLRLRTAQGLLPESSAAAATAVVDRVAIRAGVPPERLEISETAARLRLACLYLFRPAWRPLAARSLTATVGRILAP